MIKSMRLGDAVDQFLLSRQSRGIAANTLRADRSTLTQLVTSVGNIYVRSIEPRHIDTFFAERAHLKPGSRNVTLTRLRVFFSWAKGRGYIVKDPTTDFGRVKQPVEDRFFLPVEDFPRLLDAADHPRDRIFLALAMYLFARSSEIQSLQVGDVDLDQGEIRVRVHKTKDFDYMPICLELEEELRVWLTWYGQEVQGPLRPDMYLVPAKTGHRSRPGPDGKFLGSADPTLIEQAGVVPYRSLSRPHRVVQKALESLGYPTKGEGGHTLRRSGARALFDEIQRTEGDDRGIQQVKVMLHHKNVAMTEHYIGRAPDRAKRDRRLKGQRMFTPTVYGDTVVDLSEVLSGRQAGVGV